MKHYMSHFSIDRQGKVTKLKDIISDSSQFEVKSDEHKKPMLTPFFGTCQSDVDTISYKSYSYINSY